MEIRMKQKWICFLYMLCFLSLCGCSKRELPSAQVCALSKKYVTFTDDLHHRVQVKSADKVAVLSGSLAEAWMLAGGRLQAVTEDRFNDKTVQFPKNVICLGTLKSPNVEKMIESDIDFVILSANFPEQVALRDTLQQAGMQTAYFDIETLKDYLRMLKIFTRITGRSDLYKKNGTAIESKVQKQIARKDGSHPTVLFLRASSVGLRAKGSDSMTGEMLKDLGCVNIADQKRSLLEDLSMEEIVKLDPEYIFVSTMGESQEAAIKTVHEVLQSNPAWGELHAVKEKKYYLLPKRLFQNKPNHRWAKSYQILADILYGTEK